MGRRAYFQITLIVLLLGFAAFGGAIRSPFIWDDEILILDNPYLGREDGPLTFFSPAFWKRYYSPHDYRPVEMLSYWLDYLFWRTNPAGYHLSNILIHCFNSAALYVLLLLLFANRRIAAFASVLFVLHPMHSEAVIWIQNRSELLAAAFALLCLIAFTLSVRFPSKAFIFSLLSMLAFTLSFLAKEHTIIIPLLCAALLPLLGEKRVTAVLRRILPMLILAAALLLLRYALIGGGGFQRADPEEITAGIDFIAAAKSTVSYLIMLVLPVNFSIDRVFIPPAPFPAPGTTLSCLFVILIVLLAVREAWRPRPAGLALALLLIAILPVSNIVLLAGRPLSEQRLYLPSIGFCLLIALFTEVPLRSKIRGPAAGLLALALCTSYLIISASRTECWRDEEALWEQTLERSTQSHRPRLFLARVYSRRGRYADAIRLLKEILRNVSPRPHIPFLEMGIIYEKMGKTGASLRAYEHAVDTEPHELKARYYLGTAYLEAGRLDDARVQFEFIERNWPRNGKGQLYLGIVCKNRGEFEKAAEKIRENLALIPGNPRAIVNLAAVRAAQGRDAEAERLYRELLERHPRDVAAQNDYGLFLLDRGRTAEAIPHFEEAARLDPEKWEPPYNLARAFEARGETGKALVALMKAAERDPARGDLLREVNRLSAEIRRGPAPPALMAEILRGHRNLLRARGLYCARTGDEGEAIKYFLKLSLLSPQSAEPHANLGRIYATRGDYEKALSELHLAARLAPGEASLYSSIGSCYAKMGRLEEARTAWLKARSLDPRAREPLRNLSRLRKEESARRSLPGRGTR